MKKIIACLLCLGLLFCVTACNGQEKQMTDLTATQAVSDLSDIKNSSKEIVENSEQNILIAYFSWADNTVVTDEDAAVESVLEHYKSVGDSSEYVDAISSASVVQPGNVATIANWIQQRVGGNLFPIIVSEPYSSIYDECLERASDEKADNARPELVNHVENMDDYDVIFLGFPNWWYTAPMAIFSFIEEYDLADKTIVPFCSHGTGGLAGSVRDITDVLPDSTQILEPIGVYRADIHTAQQSVNEWLDSLGFIESDVSTESETQKAEAKRIQMIIADQEVTITLNDTPLANALFDMLPLELNFEDFNGTEKISYLPDGLVLSTEGNVAGHEPDVGDLCLYAPWGNLCIFYQEFSYSDDLYAIGHVDSGMDVFSEKRADFTAVLEKRE